VEVVVPKFCRFWLKRASEVGLDFSVHFRRDTTPVDDDLVEFLRREMDSEPDAFPDESLAEIAANKQWKWRYVSALQKAVRRGQTEEAIRCAHVLQLMGEDYYLWRRFGVIAMEDLGPPRIYPAALAMCVATKPSLRKELGSYRLSSYLLRQMCEGSKTRALCWMITLLDWMGWRVEEARKLVQQPPAQLVDVASDREQDWYLRCVALWGVLGTTGGYKSVKLPEVTREQSEQHQMIAEVCARLELPTLVRYVMHRAINVHAHAALMASSFPWLWELAESEKCTEQFRLLRRSPRIGGVNAEAYDIHTSEGKRAFSYFAKACPPMRDFFEGYPDTNVVELLGKLVFLIEGSVVNRELIFPGRDQVYHLLENVSMTQNGLSLNEGTVLLNLIYDNMPALHEARKRIAEG